MSIFNATETNWKLQECLPLNNIHDFTFDLKAYRNTSEDKIWARYENPIYFHNVHKLEVLLLSGEFVISDIEFLDMHTKESNIRRFYDMLFNHIPT